MDELKSLVTKHTANESADKWKNSPGSQPTLTPRQLAIAALIQRTQERRGLPLKSAGFELQNALRAWGDAVQNVPDEYLTRAYNRAADNWPWTDRKDFLPDAVAESYKILLVEDRQRVEAEKRNAARRNPDTYRCYHCQDMGYQGLYTYQHGLWYSSQRPCCCEAAPANQRQQFPLDETVWFCNRYGLYVSRTDIEKYGVPNSSFKDAISSK